MKTDTGKRIVEYITTRGQARPGELALHFGLSAVAIHKQLKKLVDAGAVVKNGTPPHVFYAPPVTAEKTQPVPLDLPKNTLTAINEHFLSITPSGKLLYGIEGFIYWHQQNKPKTSLENVAHTYLEALHKKQDSFLPWTHAIDASQKLRETFIEKAVNHLFFYDIYSVPVFGRTKWARLVMYAKQSENIHLVETIAAAVRPTIQDIIHRFTINAVAYIPPTISRPIQFMDELERLLHVKVPTISLVKVSTNEIVVPQKTLSTLSERVENAANSIFVNTGGTEYDRILLIDDVAGSGASFHETAGKMKKLGYGTKQIVAFSIVGNLHGYDVIRQI